MSWKEKIRFTNSS